MSPACQHLASVACAPVPKEDGLETSPYRTGLLARICLANWLGAGSCRRRRRSLRASPPAVAGAYGGLSVPKRNLGGAGDASPGGSYWQAPN